MTISNTVSQFELSIFSDKLLEYKNLIKEGNLLIFHVDITRDKDNLRLIIRKIEDLKEVFSKQKFKINVYLSPENKVKIINRLIVNRDNQNNLFVYFNKNEKLISLDFSNKYQISNYIVLDQMHEAKKIDYSLELL